MELLIFVQPVVVPYLAEEEVLKVGCGVQHFTVLNVFGTDVTIAVEALSFLIAVVYALILLIVH